MIISDELCNYKPISVFKVTIWLTVSTGFFFSVIVDETTLTNSHMGEKILWPE